MDSPEIAAVALVFAMIFFIAIVQTAIQTADAARSLKRIEQLLRDGAMERD